jgi:Circularly permutated YpsA SLOG family
MVAERRAGSGPKKLACNSHETRMKLLSGGQSGVDRAVLDVAIARGIDYGGWCPKDGWAEDLSAPPGLLAKYPRLKETPLADPAQRTEWNVRDADACIIVVAAGGLAVSKGTVLAEELAHRHRKPLLVVDLGDPEPVEHAALWLRVQQRRVGADLVLAIGGPRASEAPGIYVSATKFIHALLDLADRN